MKINPSAIWMLSCYFSQCCCNGLKANVLTWTQWTRFWNYFFKNKIKIKEDGHTRNINWKDEFSSYHSGSSSSKINIIIIFFFIFQLEGITAIYKKLKCEEYQDMGMEILVFPLALHISKLFCFCQPLEKVFSS